MADERPVRNGGAFFLSAGAWGLNEEQMEPGDGSVVELSYEDCFLQFQYK